MEKLMKISRVLDTVVRVLTGIFFGLGCASTLLMAAALCLPASRYESLVGKWLNLEFGSITLTLKEPLSAPENLKPSICVLLLTALAALFFMAWVGREIHRLLLPMKEGRPFDCSVPATLNRLGWMTIIESAVFFLLRGISLFLAAHLYALSGFFGDNVNGYTINLQYDLGWLLMAGMLFLLAHIFKYGEELQRLSDETL